MKKGSHIVRFGKVLALILIVHLFAAVMVFSAHQFSRASDPSEIKNMHWLNSGFGAMALLAIAFFYVIWKKLSVEIALAKRNSSGIYKNRIDEMKNLSVARMISKRSGRTTIRLTIFLTSASFLYPVICGNLSIPQDNLFLALLTVLVILLLLRSLLINLRIARGLYGETKAEALEVIRFLLKHQNDMDFMDGGKPKALINPKDLKQISLSIEDLGNEPIPATN